MQYTDNATQEDIDNNLVYWADLFKATTWEEFLAIASEHSYMKEVFGLVYEMNTDKQTKEILEGQRRYREQLASQYVAGRMDAEEEYKEIIEQKDATIADKDATIAEKDATIADKDETIAALKAKIEALKNK